MPRARRRVAGTLALAVAAAGAVAGVAGGDPAADSGFLIASTGETGYVSIAAFGAPGGSAAFTEEVGTQRVPLATVPVSAAGNAPLARAVPWRCDRQVRRFAAVLTGADGSVRRAVTDIRTPSCANRVSVLAPRHVARGAVLTVRLVDRWGLGDQSVRLCASGGGLRHRCRAVTPAAGARGVVARFRVPGDGQVRLALGLAGHRVSVRVAAGTARPLAARSGPLLLTTGDSTIEGIDSVLGDALGSAARVRAESAPGTRLSGTGEPDWRRRAASQVRRLHPRVTVLSLGANESFPVTAPGTARPVACCGPGWVAGLAARQRGLMRLYLQGGRGVVVWLLIPVPRDAGQAAVVAAANHAVLTAAAGLAGVRVLDLGTIFTPDGAFHASISRRGHRVRVRAPDGLHLSAAGQVIAGDAVRALLARDGLLD